MSWIITGAAGFIGSCLLAKLNREGMRDLIIVDNIAQSHKWLNILNKQYAFYIPKNELLHLIQVLPNIEGVVHLGACSSTTEQDFDYLYANNFQYSIELYKFCTTRKIPFIFASSAAVYGDGKYGFSEDCDLQKLVPLNRYGYLKLLFERWVIQQQDRPAQWVGLRLFNVYGPNEYHKGHMASMIYFGYQQIISTKKIQLFKSEKSTFRDGEQTRDFVFVNDVCNVIWFFMQHPQYSGIYNVGTGESHTFNDLAEYIFLSMNKPLNIEYIDMPTVLARSYQYFTKAEINKLRNCGYMKPFTILKDGVGDYVRKYLSCDYKVL